MAAPSYQLFNLRPSAAQTSVDALVSALWRRLFPGQSFGQNHRLDPVFARMSHWPELAAANLCPYYFDQVTYSLPTRDQVKHMESCNLRLHWFNSWANLTAERPRATEQYRKPNVRTNRDAEPNAGIHLSRLCQLQDPNTGGSLSSEQYIHLMYGCHLTANNLLPLCHSW